MRSRMRRSMRMGRGGPVRSPIGCRLGSVPCPGRNLQRWGQWVPVVTEIVGSGDEATLTGRAELAYWTGRSGDAAGGADPVPTTAPRPDGSARTPPSRHPQPPAATSPPGPEKAVTSPAALTLYQQLLPDQEEVLGPRHPNTLETRGDIAAWTGEAGDAASALTLFQQLLPDLLDVLGACRPRHPRRPQQHRPMDRGERRRRRRVDPASTTASRSRGVARNPPPGHADHP